MSVTFHVKTFEAYDSPVVEFKKKVIDDWGKPLPISPGKNNIEERGFESFSIDIHEIVNEDDKRILLRKRTNSIQIELLPDWVDYSKFSAKLAKILNKGEVPEDVLSITVRLVCPKIGYVIESKQISLGDVLGRKPIKFFSFLLVDVIGKIEVQSELIRIKSSNPSSSTTAFSNLTILARNKTIVFYIDEIDDIGSNSLQLLPEDTKDKMFVMKNLFHLAAEPPTLYYHKQFKDFFNNGNEYRTVQTLMLLIGLPYCEQLLKWIIFGKPDYEKKEHKAIIKFLADLCDIREIELESITSQTDDSVKISEYLKLSNLLFENIQSVGSGWKKMLYEIITNEKK